MFFREAEAFVSDTTLEKSSAKACSSSGVSKALDIVDGATCRALDKSL